jgi:hypothetical protein
VVLEKGLDFFHPFHPPCSILSHCERGENSSVLTFFNPFPKNSLEHTRRS